MKHTCIPTRQRKLYEWVKLLQDAYIQERKHIEKKRGDNQKNSNDQYTPHYNPPTGNEPAAALARLPIYSIY